MPMQPSPIAETSRPLFPSLRFCIVISVIIFAAAVTLLNRHQPDRRRSRLWTHDRIDDAFGIATVFGAVCGVDPFVEFRVRVETNHFFLDAARLHSTFVPHLNAAKPPGG